jgi:hypothetical protein
MRSASTAKCVDGGKSVMWVNYDGIGIFLSAYKINTPSNGRGAEKQAITATQIPSFQKPTITAVPLEVLSCGVYFLGDVW